MKANLSLNNAIFNIWMVAVHPSRNIRVTSVDWGTNSWQLPSCLALKTIPSCFEIVVTFCRRSLEVHVSIRCIESDVARTFRNNCRRKTLDFLRLFGDGCFNPHEVTLTICANKQQRNARRRYQFARQSTNQIEMPILTIVTFPVKWFLHDLCIW